MTMEQTASPAPTVNVQEIMERIRQRIDEKKKTGEYTPEELERIDRYVLQIEAEGYNTPEEDIRQHLSVLNYLFDTLKPPEFSSHRQRFGGFVTGIKKTIRRITEPYIQMILKRQVDFNAETVRLLNQLVSDYRFRVSALEQQIAQRPEEALAQEKRWEALSRQVNDLTQEIRAQKNTAEDLLVRIKSAGAQSGGGPGLPEDGPSRIRAFEYLRFENRHRGPEEVIRTRQRRYLPYFRQTGKVLGPGVRAGGIPGAAARGGPGGCRRGIESGNGGPGPGKGVGGHRGRRTGLFEKQSRPELGRDFSVSGDRAPGP